MGTTDLLLTWQTLIEPLLFPADKQYEFEFLDSIYDVKMQVFGEVYIISIMHPFDEIKQIAIPIHTYNKVIHEGIMHFATFIVNNKILFTHESLYDSFIEDYKRIKKQPQI